MCLSCASDRWADGMRLGVAALRSSNIMAASIHSGPFFVGSLIIRKIPTIWGLYWGPRCSETSRNLGEANEGELLRVAGLGLKEE